MKATVQRRFGTVVTIRRLFAAGILGMIIAFADAALGQSIYSTPYAFTTLAGYAGFGSVDGTGSAARFNMPWSIAVDSVGNMYVTDFGNYTIRKASPVGNITTLAGYPGVAGTNDGTGGAARFTAPAGIAVNAMGIVYVTDNDTIRQVSPAGVVTTLAGLAGTTGTNDGTGSGARFNNPTGIVVDAGGNLFVADTGNLAIRQVTPSGLVTTLARNDSFGPLLGPMGVAVDGAENIYVADSSANVIFKVARTGNVTMFAGVWQTTGTNDGGPGVAQFFSPESLILDSHTNIYVADTQNFTIRKITPAGIVTTIAGAPGNYGYADGIGSTAQFVTPTGVTVDSAGNLFVADNQNGEIRKVSPAGTNWAVTTFAGFAYRYGGDDGLGSEASFNAPDGAVFDPAGNLYVAGFKNETIRKVTPEGLVTTLAGVDGQIGTNDGQGAAARFYGPSCLTLDGTGNVIVTDSVNHTVRKVTTNGLVTTFAGQAGIPGTNDGTGSQIEFNRPFGVALDIGGNIYVTDYGNNTIRQLVPTGTNWISATIAGSAQFDQSGFAIGGSADGTNANAQFYGPVGLAVDKSGVIFVADLGNKTIRRIAQSGTNWVVTTIAGQTGVIGSSDGMGTNATFNSPIGLAIDSDGRLFVTDLYNHTIRSIVPLGSNWMVSTLAGRSGTADEWGTDGTGAAAGFYQPYGIAVDGFGNLCVTDLGNNTIRIGVPASSILPPIMQSATTVGVQFGCGITGLQRLAVDISSSTDLVQWQWTGTYILNGGTNFFVDSSPVQPSAKFFRARVR